MNRWKAATAHLGISAIVAIMVVTLMRLLWYPGPYFALMGGATLLILIVGCDVVLGPLITLIIFKRGKKGLKLDLATIACIQLAALAYGGYTVYTARPVFTVFVVDRFEVVAANDIKSTELAKGKSNDFASLSFTGPRVVAATLPDDSSERVQITIRALNGGDDIKQLPRFYVPYQQVAKEAAQHARSISVLEKRDANASEMIRNVAQKTGKAVSDLGFLPLTGRMQSMSSIVDRQSGDIYDVLPVNPW